MNNDASWDCAINQTLFSNTRPELESQDGEWVMREGTMYGYETFRAVKVTTDVALQALSLVVVRP